MPLSRRTVLMTPFLISRSLQAAPRARLLDTTIISLDHNNYHGWPTVARRANGELLVACSGGRETHVCPFGRVDLIRSNDDGRTWTWPETLMDTAIDDRDAGVLETAKGTLLVSTFTSLAYEPVLEKAANWPAERLSRWRAVHSRLTASQRQSMLGTWLLRSTDGGMNWSAPYRVPVNSPHGPIALNDGSLLYAGKQLWSSPKRVGVSISKDDGVTWSAMADLPTRRGDDFDAYHELHAVQAANGRIIVQIRNHNKANVGETLQCESEDGGKTWTTPHSIGVWGLPSHLLRLRNGNLLMSYGHRRKPFGNQARLSADHGKTWSEPVTLSEDGLAGDLGYPSTVELANGDLLTVWYELLAGSQRAVLRQARWRIEV
jgi:sialidase-1